MSKVVDDFLAHHGIKGMRWGVRRESTSGSGGTTVVKAPTGLKLTDPAHPLHGAGLTVTSGKGTKRDPFVVEKLSGHEAGAQHPSVDAERFVQTHQKAGHEMSTREIKEAVARANLVESYNKLFSPSPNKELQAKVESLQLEKQFGTLSRELHPSAATRVARFVSSAGKTGFKTYNMINKATNGELNSHMVTRLGLEKSFPSLVKTVKDSSTTSKSATPTLNKNPVGFG